MPKKKKKAEDINQLSPESEAQTATKKAAKRQTPRRATAAKKPPKPRDTSERTAHISVDPQPDVTACRELSEDAVRLRAYFISERRRRFALPGDTESDWLEAKRQLLAEADRQTPKQQHNGKCLADLAQALRERLAVIGDEASRRDQAKHIDRLRAVLQKIDRLQESLPSSTDSRLKHYLDRKSYDKALEFLQDQL